MSALCQKQTLACLFDHLIGAGEKAGRNFEAECLCSPEIDDQFELGRLLSWQTRRLGAVENLVHKLSGAAVDVGERRP